MLERMHLRLGFRPVCLLLLAMLLVLCRVSPAQEGKTALPAAVPGRGAVQISFLPPPLENATFSLGIYEAKSGKLVRRLHEYAPESAFTVGLNGLITKWDGKDDSGQPAPSGHYAARGFAVGALQVTGVNILGNDWTSEDESVRPKGIKGIDIPNEHHGLGISNPDENLEVFAYLPGGGTEKLLFSRDGKLLRRYPPDVADPDAVAPNESSPGQGGTVWAITDAGAVVQKAPDGTVLRQLAPQPGQPVPVMVCASTKEDRLYLLEKTGQWQRVRGLSWVETKEENGQQVSTWQTFFERNIRPPDPALGLENPAHPVEVTLVDNPLSPGQAQKVRLAANYDAKGSYLTTVDGLRLRQISQRADLQAARVAKGKSDKSLAFFQSDGAAWDEFSIERANDMMSFDAGEFELNAQGEKPPEAKSPEPPDL